MRLWLSLPLLLLACREPTVIQDQATTETIQRAKTSGLQTATFALG